MNKKEKIVFYHSLCAALVLHILLFLFLFLHHDTPFEPSPTDYAPVTFNEIGESGTPHGSPDGTEVAKTVPEQDVQEEAAIDDLDTTAEESAQLVQEQEPPSFPETETITSEVHTPTLHPLYSPHAKQETVVPQQIEKIREYTTEKKQEVVVVVKTKRKRAAWHSVSTAARTRAMRLNIQKSVRTFTDQQYDAYGDPDGSGGSGDHGTGTGGGGNARYHANINSLDLIRQSYMKKVVRAIVTQSQFMQLMAYSPTPIHKTVGWHIQIGPDSKIKSMKNDEECSPSIDSAIRKIFYATQLPPLPTRLKDGFTWHTSIMVQHGAQTGPLVLTAVTD